MKYADGTLTFNRGDTLNFVDINDIYNWKEIVFPLEMGLTEMIFINDDTYIVGLEKDFILGGLLLLTTKAKHGISLQKTLMLRFQIFST